MATQLQIRRGTSSQVAAFTGAVGELVVNTTNDSVHVNDGSTAGGFELARVDGSNWAITNNITTTANIDVGTVTADGLTVDGVSKLKAGSTSTPADTAAFISNASAKLVVNHGNEYGAYVGYANSSNDAIGIQSTTSGGTTAPLSLNPYGGNVGIGTTAASHKLEIESSSDADLLQVQSTAGSNDTALRLGISGDVATINATGGSTGILALKTYGTERVRVNASGQVGIGTSSPDALMRVNGTAKIGEGVASNTAKLMVNTASGVAAGIQLFQDGTESWIIQNPASTTALTFANSGTERMRLDGSGDITVKGGRIFVNESDNGNTAVAITRDADEGYVNLYSSGTQKIEIRGNGNSYFNGGNVGIGTTNPLMNLHLSDTGDTGIQITKDGSVASRIKTVSGALAIGVDGANGDTERMRVDASGNVLVGTTSTTPAFSSSGSGIAFKSSESAISADGAFALVLNRNTSDGVIQQFRKAGSTVGSIGTASGTFWIGSGDVGLVFDNATSNSEQIRPYNTASGTRDAAIDLGMATGRFKDLYLSGGVKVPAASKGIEYSSTAFITPENNVSGAEVSTPGAFVVKTGSTPAERLRLDASGNLLVSKSSVSTSTVGVELRETGKGMFTASGTDPVFINRLSSDGAIAKFSKDNGDVGSIGTLSGDLNIGSGDTGLDFSAGLDAIMPYNPSTNGLRDNTIDLGQSSVRFDDIYATNGTIQTSDRNEKQDIEALSDAEQRVAVAAKGLLRKFRWKSSVAENGDDARIHFGIIAQDLQEAFEAEGLDAGRYAMFINSTWTDEDTGEERTRMGVRYSELLAFIIAAI